MTRSNSPGSGASRGETRSCAIREAICGVARGACTTPGDTVDTIFHVTPAPMGGCVGTHHDSSGSLNENSDGTGGKEGSVGWVRARGRGGGEMERDSLFFCLLVAQCR